MPDARNQSAADSVGAGWADLAGGRWEAARARFEDAVGVAPSAEAFEVLGWSAWWLDDADAVFEAREQAYRLYAQSADPASAARVATWLAADNLDFRGALSARAALPPVLWGSEEHVRELFGDRVTSLDMRRAHYVERAASPRDYCELFNRTFGPAVGLRAAG